MKTGRNTLNKKAVSRKKPTLAKKTVDVLSKKGIVVPVLRDPVTQKPSVSYSLLAISANLVIVGILSDKINTDTALQFFYACAGLYFGRKLSFGRNITFNNKG